MLCKKKSSGVHYLPNGYTVWIMALRYLQWAHPSLMLVACIALAGVFILRSLRHYKIYKYPLVTQLLRSARFSWPWVARVQRPLLWLAALLCMIAAGGPALLVGKSASSSEGIDIMVVLDVSGSMQQQDDPTSPSRLEIAKQEAIRFIKQRPEDKIGLVIFAYGAVCRCPLTHDHQALIEIIQQLQINSYLPHHLTHLFRGIASALNRLQGEDKTTKVIILITDGNSNQGDATGKDVISIAQELGIKIYTIGIGARRMNNSPFAQFFDEGPNQQLLEAIATATGAKCYMASTQQELQQVYNAINALEKRQYEVEILGNYKDIGWQFAVAGAVIYAIYLLLSWWVVLL